MSKPTMQRLKWGWRIVSGLVLIFTAPAAIKELPASWKWWHNSFLGAVSDYAVLVIFILVMVGLVTSLVWPLIQKFVGKRSIRPAEKTAEARTEIKETAVNRSPANDSTRVEREHHTTELVSLLAKGMVPKPAPPTPARPNPRATHVVMQGIVELRLNHVYNVFGSTTVSCTVIGPDQREYTGTPILQQLPKLYALYPMMPRIAVIHFPTEFNNQPLLVGGLYRVRWEETNPVALVTFPRIIHDAFQY